MTIMNGEQTLKKINQISKRFNEVVSTKKETAKLVAEVFEDDGISHELAPNGKRYRTYNQHDLSVALLDGSRNTKALSDLADQLDIKGIFDTQKGGRVWSFTQPDVNRMAEHLGKRLPYQRKGHLQVIPISNLKGGCSKSTFCINVPAALAVNGYYSYRILVIDLDPQGSLTNTMTPFLEAGDYVSIGDLLSKNIDLDEGETFADAVQQSCLKTNIPNLDIIPADTNDVSFDAFVRNKQFQAFKEGKPYSSHDAFEPIIDALKDKYDAIFIDTPPRVSEAVVAAHYSATSLIVPMRPAQSDHDSSDKYLQNIGMLYKQFVQLGHKGYDFIRLIQTGAQGGSDSDFKISRQIKAKLGGNCLVDFKISEAIKRCSEIFKGLFELSASEYAKRDTNSKTTQQGSRSSIIRAQDNAIEIALDLEAVMQQAWDDAELTETK